MHAPDPDARASDPAEERKAAEQAALRILRGAAQSEAALRMRLQHRGFSAEAAEAAAAGAAHLGYVDDAALARSIVDRRRTRRGPARIAAELRSRGLPPSLARTAVAAISPEEQRSAALAEAQRRLTRSRADPSDRRHLARIAAALGRLGFPSDVIAHALASLGAEATEEGA